MPGAPAAPPAGIALLFQPPPGSATPAWFSTWATAAQLWGTDKRPTIAAWLGPAENPFRFTLGSSVEPTCGPAGIGPELGRFCHTPFPSPEPMGGTGLSCPPRVTAL